MKKKLIGRGVIGFPVGIAIGYVITVIISICIGDGFFHPVTPELANKMGSELNAAQALQWLRLFGRSIRGVLQSKAGFTSQLLA